MTHYFRESLSVVILSLVVNFLSEFVAYIFVYNKSEYKEAKKRLEKVSEEISKRTSDVVASNEEKKHKKLIQKLKDEERTLKQEMTGMSFRSTMILSMTMMLLFGVFRSYYDGIVVAKLPFTPFALVRGMLHGRLRSKDYTDVAMSGLYFLCNMAFRQTIKMILRTQSPRGSQGIFPSMEEMEEKLEKYQ
ncbi:hypothetical protein WA538_005513 [Blastocystis sp. DL]